MIHDVSSTYFVLNTYIYIHTPEYMTYIISFSLFFPYNVFQRVVGRGDFLRQLKTWPRDMNVNITAACFPTPKATADGHEDGRVDLGSSCFHFCANRCYFCSRDLELQV